AGQRAPASGSRPDHPTRRVALADASPVHELCWNLEHQDAGDDHACRDDEHRVVGAARQVLDPADHGVPHAKWLSDKEKELLQAAVKAEAGAKQHHSMKDAFAEPKVWLRSR